jgi:hypothetical protein
MSPEDVKATLGNPSKVIDLGAKKVFVYSDMKIVFNDGKVSDVQYGSLPRDAGIYCKDLRGPQAATVAEVSAFHLADKH